MYNTLKGINSYMKKFIAFIMLIALVIVSACINKDVDGKRNEDIRISLANKAKTFDPALAFDDDSLMVISQSIESLYQYHYLKRPYEVIPALAEDMPIISNNGKTYTIKIKRGIKYHHLTSFKNIKKEVTAHDFVMQMKRIAYKKTKSLGTWLFSGKVKGFDDFTRETKNLSSLFKNSISGFYAIDDRTLRIELKRPEPNLLFFLSTSFLAPIPEELVRFYKNDLSQVLIGTGPYYLKSLSENRYTFLKNPNYRKEMYPSSGDRYANTQKMLSSSSKVIPFLEKVTFEVIPSEDDRWNRFLAGDLDILSVPKKYLDIVSNNNKEFRELQKEKNFEVKYFSTISSRWLSFNMRDDIVGKNLKLRQAIAHAINYDEYIEKLTNNTNLKANSIYNPSIPGYRPSNELGVKYDLEKAKKLIKESGVKNLSLTYSTRGTQNIYKLEAKLLTKYLKAIGIELKIEYLSFSDFLKKGRAGKLQFFTDNWIYDYPDAENNIQLLISKNAPGINKSGYNSKKVDDLYKRLAKTLDPEKRIEIMNEVEKQVKLDLPWIMMMYDSSYVLHSKKIKNFRKSFFIRNYVKFIEKY